MTRASVPVRRIAWTCLFAVWLAIVAPVVTQLRAAAYAQLPDVALCSGRTGADSDARSPVAHHGAAGNCGYCDLLAHYPPLQGAIAASNSPEQFSEARFSAAVATHMAVRRFVFAWSRDPPYHVS